MKISIVTINFNNAQGLQKTISSVLAQTYNNIEYILIDGGSIDGSVEILKRFKDEVAYWISEPDTGVYNAMNKGISAATGEFLLFINSGDVLLNESVIDEAVSFGLDRDLVYGDIVYIESGTERKWVVDDKLSFETFYKATIPHPATFIKRSLFEVIGLYNENNKIVSDWEFFMLATCKYNCSYKHIDLCVAMFYQGGMSSDPENYPILTRERAATLNAHFPFFIKDYERLEQTTEALRKVRRYVKVKNFVKELFNKTKHKR